MDAIEKVKTCLEREFCDNDSITFWIKTLGSSKLLICRITSHELFLDLEIDTAYVLNRLRHDAGYRAAQIEEAMEDYRNSFSGMA